MIKYIFNPNYIKGHELIFYLSCILILLVIIVTIIFVRKEIKKK